MFNIIHYFKIKSEDMSEIYRAVTTQEGLSGWWTARPLAFPRVGARIRFDFSKTVYLEFIITELRENEYVEWEFTGGNEEWSGTKVSFELLPAEGSTNIRFKHLNWPEETDHFAECNFHWGLYMKSLKSLIETGKGTPHIPV